MVKVNFQRFVPEIDIADTRSWFWKEGIESPEIFIPLWQLLVNKELLNKASSKGLHDFLGFNGRIFLSTVMPDELLDRLGVGDYFKLIKNLRPDATMVPDNYTYTDDPLFLSWSQTVKLFSLANNFLKLDIPLIGLVKGANHLQIDWVIRKQTEMGYVSFAMPVRELLQDTVEFLEENKEFSEENLELLENTPLNSFVKNAIISLKWFFKRTENNFELIIYGISWRLKYKGLSYSNLSWFLDAKHGIYFKDGKPHSIRDPAIRFEECNCDACKGLMPQEILDTMSTDKALGIKTLVIHNLLDMRRTMANGSRWEEVQGWDNIKGGSLKERRCVKKERKNPML
ncbi:MAG: hypothetical protein QXZ66_04480 [Thermoproteota archaeon]